MNEAAFRLMNDSCSTEESTVLGGCCDDNGRGFLLGSARSGLEEGRFGVGKGAMVGNDGCDFVVVIAAGLGVGARVGVGDMLELGVDGLTFRRGVVNLAIARSNSVGVEEGEDSSLAPGGPRVEANGEDDKDEEGVKASFWYLI
jgi:hypothetical protein